MSNSQLPENQGPGPLLESGTADTESIQNKGNSGEILYRRRSRSSSSRSPSRHRSSSSRSRSRRPTRRSYRSRERRDRSSHGSSVRSVSRSRRSRRSRHHHSSRHSRRSLSRSPRRRAHTRSRSPSRVPPRGLDPSLIPFVTSVSHLVEKLTPLVGTMVSGSGPPTRPASLGRAPPSPERSSTTHSKPADGTDNEGRLGDLEGDPANSDPAPESDAPLRREYLECIVDMCNDNLGDKLAPPPPEVPRFQGSIYVTDPDAPVSKSTSLSEPIQFRTRALAPLNDAAHSLAPGKWLPSNLLTYQQSFKCHNPSVPAREWNPRSIHDVIKPGYSANRDTLSFLNTIEKSVSRSSNLAQMLGTLILTFDSLVKADPDATQQWCLLSKALCEVFDQLQINMALSSGNLTLLQRDLLLAKSPLPQSSLDMLRGLPLFEQELFPTDLNVPQEKLRSDEAFQLQQDLNKSLVTHLCKSKPAQPSQPSSQTHSPSSGGRGGSSAPRGGGRGRGSFNTGSKRGIPFKSRRSFRGRGQDPKKN